MDRRLRSVVIIIVLVGVLMTLLRHLPAGVSMSPLKSLMWSFIVLVALGINRRLRSKSTFVTDIESPQTYAPLPTRPPIDLRKQQEVPQAESGGCHVDIEDCGNIIVGCGSGACANCPSKTVGDTQEFRRALMKKSTYIRPTPEELKGLQIVVGPSHVDQPQSVPLDEAPLEDILSNLKIKKTHTIRNLKFILADAFGFCWGVERSIAVAMYAVKKFPAHRVFLTNELIHNPVVNSTFENLGVRILNKNTSGKRDFSHIRKGDVVILPAFGSPVEELRQLDVIGAIIVDSACPWVSKVWTAVEKHKKLGYTSIIHGTLNHEETEATISFADKYVVVKNADQARAFAAFIAGESSVEELFEFLPKRAFSNNFEFDSDLKKIGIANQTTMLKSETEEITEIIKTVLTRKYGPNAFMSMDTICDATQERQDAIIKLTSENDLDIMLVVGGFNSSNTTHLLEIAKTSHRVKHAFHIQDGDCIKDDNSIEHQVNKELVITRNFLSKSFITVGVTSGASTPDHVVNQCLVKIHKLSQTL